jgi:hypothetical protein
MGKDSYAVDLIADLFVKGAENFQGAEDYI